MTSPIPSEPRTPRQLYHAAPSTAAAVWITAGAIVAIYVLQLALASFAPPLAAIAVTYVATAAGLVIAARWARFSLGLRPARYRFWIAALLVGSSAWYVDLRLVEWLQPAGNPAHLEALVARSALMPSLVAIAILPALAEELVFRGVLARAFARRSAIAAIIGSTMIFSAYHVLPIQVVATFPLGLALATLAVRSDSVLPGMLAHFLNNATVIVLSRDDLPDVGHAIDAHPTVALASAIVVAALGVTLAAKGVA